MAVRIAGIGRVISAVFTLVEASSYTLGHKKFRQNAPISTEDPNIILKLAHNNRFSAEFTVEDEEEGSRLTRKRRVVKPATPSSDKPRTTRTIKKRTIKKKAKIKKV